MTSTSSVSALSPAQRFRLLPREVRLARIASMSDREASSLRYDWDWWARPSQRLPIDPWRFWLIKAGRGYGKTRVGGEVVRRWVRTNRYVNLIGATSDDARDIMIEGESGILAITPKAERPIYRPSKRRLEWPNGARSLIFTADEPERLRGKQHWKIWADELASWRYASAWDQAKFGLRLGKNPQAVITTTPKPTKLVRELAGDPRTFVTNGSTSENVDNLAKAFLEEIVAKYVGTRLGRQELEGEILDDNPNALWLRSSIEDARVEIVPYLSRVVVAIDPPASSKEDSDEAGIVAVAKDNRSPCHFYVLADESRIASPAAWARIAIALGDKLGADRFIGEQNNGGEMVESTLRNVDHNISYRGVHASRGKVVRAEPVAALYEQGRVHHVGAFPVLEDQMCNWDPKGDEDSPDRMDALVWGITELMGKTSLDSYSSFLDRQIRAQKGTA